MCIKTASFVSGMIIFGGLFVFSAVCWMFGFGQPEPVGAIGFVSMAVTIILMAIGMEQNQNEEGEEE